MANIYKRWLCEESLKTPSSRPILIYFEFRSKPSLITVIWMDPHSPKKFIGTKYCFFILGDDTSFFFFLSFFVSLFFVFMLCYVIYFVTIIFCKNCFLSIVLFIIYYYYYYLINFFFHKKKYILIFSCSGMFRDVPCSWFYRRPFLTWSQLVSKPQAIFLFLSSLMQRGAVLQLYSSFC